MRSIYVTDTPNTMPNSPIARFIHDLYGAMVANLLLSLALLAGILLLFGAWKRYRRDGAGQQMWLMIAAALVIFVNIAIWVVPNEAGNSLVSRPSSKP